MLLAALSAQATEAPTPHPAWKHLLQEQITRARRTHPQAFLRLAVAASRVDAMDAKKQATLAATAPGLRALGPEALWPMVERLAFPSQDKSSLPMRESARLALTVGLVEATGALRDARLAPLWMELLEARDTPPLVLHAAAGALARLETLDAANALIAFARQEGPRGEAALDALGLCRRLVATRALAEALDARPDRERMRHIARALGDAGSVWAWKTPGVKARSEEGAIRRVAAEALVRVYLGTDGDVRRAVSNALLRVDAPETPALIDAARARAEPPQQAELDALSERLRRNPLR
ncbi:hypothetical protein A176_000474 [Myxococcus hansupus]|uniref:HEAT repeat domain-containing protein n=1 Tax=Pseudomyxococcus hansupus TaxID=1297742 RepID=A0A0H4X6T6_9BACT|nr:hypothetical protein A176_000474 [Myxococcus hansupus]